MIFAASQLALAAAATMLLAALVVMTVRARRRARTYMLAIEAWTTAYAIGVSKNAGAGVVLATLRALAPRLGPDVNAALNDASNRLNREAVRRAQKATKKSLADIRNRPRSSMTITRVPAPEPVGEKANGRGALSSADVAGGRSPAAVQSGEPS